MDDVPISTACSWIETALGIQQTSNAWGNAYGDNTLMGCNALSRIQLDRASAGGDSSATLLAALSAALHFSIARYCHARHVRGAAAPGA